MNQPDFQRFMTELDLLVTLKEPRSPVELGLWARMVGGLDFEDACRCRDECFADWVRYPTPGDILKRIRVVRSRRIAVHGPVLPDVDPDDVSAFQAARRAATHRIAGVTPAGRSLDAGHRVLEA